MNQFLCNCWVCFPMPLLAIALDQGHRIARRNGWYLKCPWFDTWYTHPAHPDVGSKGGPNCPQYLLIHILSLSSALISPFPQFRIASTHPYCGNIFMLFPDLWHKLIVSSLWVSDRTCVSRWAGRMPLKEWLWTKTEGHDSDPKKSTLNIGGVAHLPKVCQEDLVECARVFP